MVDGMVDLENVIKRLEHAVDVFDGRIFGPMYDMWMDATKDAIALLKEQEPVEPIPTADDDWICGACNNSVVGTTEIDEGGFVPVRFNYCQNCGRAVKWNG